MDAACPEESALAAYARDELPGEAARRVALHVDDCARCAAAVARLETREGRGLLQRPAGARELSSVALTPSELLEGIGGGGAIAQSPRSCDLGDAAEIGDFRLLGRVDGGDGAFACVYLAQQKSMQRIVALKVSSQPTHEARLLSSLDHPHIVRVYDERFLAERGLNLLYMQFAPGGSLKQVIARLAALPAQERRGRVLLETVRDRLAARGEARADAASEFLAAADWPLVVCWLGARLADALHYAHERGVRHRDIKPANVLLNADGQPLLADFNLSFNAQVQGATAEEHFGGSLAYMSPEQLRAIAGEAPADEVGPASDLYSLGVLLWELATGKRPYADDSFKPDRPSGLGRMLAARRTPPRPEDVHPPLPRGLEATLQRCLALEPQDRPRDGRQVARALSLCQIPATRDLYWPAPGSWAARLAAWPATVLVACGLGINGLIASVNIAFNNRNLSLDVPLLVKHEKIFNPVAFPAAVAVLLTYAWPYISALHALRRGQPLSPERRREALRRCTAMPQVTWAWVLGLWLGSGLLFPLWEQWERPELRMPLRTVAEFFTSQLLHGAIASSMTYLALAYATTRIFWPRLLPEAADEVAELAPTEQRLQFHAALLGLVPPASLAAVSLFDHREPTLLLMLGAFGALGYGFALYVAPKIRGALAALRVAMAPTAELLRFFR